MTGFAPGQAVTVTTTRKGVTTKAEGLYSARRDTKRGPFLDVKIGAVVKSVRPSAVTSR